jgi:hypothetical protein
MPARLILQRGVMPHDERCRRNAITGRGERLSGTRFPRAEPVIVSACDIRLPDLLRHIEAGHVVIIVPAPGAPAR